MMLTIPKKCLKTILFIFCFGFFFSAFSASSEDSLKLNSYLKKLNLENISPLVLAAIEPKECQKYKIALQSLIKLANQQQFSQKVVFLVRGLRTNEISYFAEQELNLPPDNFRVLSQDDFFSFINPNLVTSLIIIQNSSKIMDMPIYEGITYLQDIFPVNKYELIFVDSVIIEESTRPISKDCEIAKLNDSLIVLLDQRYAYLSIYNTYTGKLIKQSTPHYEYEQLYSYYISNDASDLKVIREYRKKIREAGGMKEFSLKALYVSQSKIFAIATIAYIDSCAIDTLENGKKDTAVSLSFHTFLMKSDLNLENTEFIFLTSKILPSDYTLNTEGAFMINEKKNNYFFSVKKKTNNMEYRKLPFLAKLNYDTVAKKFIESEISDITLPSFFEEKKLGYNFSNFRLTFKEGNPYAYFALLPYLYNVYTKETVEIPDTTYKSTYINTDETEWHNKVKIAFLQTKTTFIHNEDWASLYSEFPNSANERYYFAVFNDKKEMLYKEDIYKRFPFFPDKFNFKLILDDASILALKFTNERVTLLRFQYRK